MDFETERVEFKLTGTDEIYKEDHTRKATCLVGYTMWLTERSIRRVQPYTTTSIYDSSK